MRYRRPVEQEEMVVIEIVSGKEILVTEGVSTCICIMIHGQYGAHPFLAMYHWDGFDVSFDKNDPEVWLRANDKIDMMIMRYVGKIKQTFTSRYANEKPQIQAMYIAGGEKATPEQSGTELEVVSLRRFLPAICRQYFEITAESKLSFQNFLTGDNQSYAFDIEFSPRGVNLILEKPHIEDNADLTSTESADSDSVSEEQTKRDFRH